MANTPPQDPTWDHRTGIDTDQPSNASSVGAITAEKVLALYDKGKKATRAAERQYWINRAYLADQQWVYWNKSTETLGLIEPDPDRVRVSIDRLKPGTRRIMAKLLRRPLVFDVPASASDDATTAGARIGEAVLRDVHREHNWEGIREEHALVTWKSGTGVLCVDWDPRAGQPLGMDPISGKPFGTGNIIESVLSLGEVVCEPGTRDIERGRWWIKCVALPPEDVRDMYKLPQTPPADASSAMSSLQRSLVSGAGDSSSDVALALTRVLTYYERPSNLGKGQVITVVNGKAVDGGVKPWPFPFTERLNMSCAVETVVENQWFGQTILSAAISPQTAYNQAHSSIIEHMKRAGNARIMVPVQVGELQLTDEPGEQVRYNAAGGVPAPNYLSPPAMPGWWVDQPERLKAEIDDMLGDHDVSRGGTSGGATSGVAIQLLIEQDDTPLGRLAKELAGAWSRYASMVLKIYEQRVNETRKARIEQAGRPPETVAWSGKSLCGQTNANVPLEQVQPRSRAAQFQLATQLKGLYPELPFQIFASIADLPGQDNLIEGVDPDIARARWENHMLGIGSPEIPEAWDNHEKHIEEHNRFRKSIRYSQATPEVREIVDMHIQGHEVEAAEEAANQMLKQMVSPALAGAAQGDQPAPLALGQMMAAEQTEDAQNQPAPGAQQAPGPSGAPEPGIPA